VTAYVDQVRGEEDLDPYLNGTACMSDAELEAVCFE